MRRLKQYLSLFLAAAMLLGALPFTALAAEEEETEEAPAAAVSYWDEVLETYVPIFESKEDAQAAGASEYALYTALDDEEKEDFEGADWLFFLAISSEEYAQAEEAGSYQHTFLVNGEEETLAFTMGEYGLSLVIGDCLFLLADNSAAPYSLKPIDRDWNTVYLTPSGFSSSSSSARMTADEIKAALGTVHVSALIAASDLTTYRAAGKTAVAWKENNAMDQYQIVDGGLDGTIDLTDLYDSYSISLELIIGPSNDVLTTSLDCVRYSVWIRLNTLSLDLSKIFTLTVAKKGESTAITPLETLGYWSSNDSGYGYLEAKLARADSEEDATYLVALAAVSNSGYAVEEIYEDEYRSADEIAEAAPVSVKETLLNADVTNSGGMEISLGRDHSKDLTAVLTAGSKTLYVTFSVRLYAASKGVRLDSYRLYYPDSEGNYSASTLQSKEDSETGSSYYEATLPYGTPANSQCFVTLEFYDNEDEGTGGGTNGINYVSAAYEGSYESQEAAQAAGAVDIKDKLFVSVSSGAVGPSTIYLSDKFAEGTQFTVIDNDGEVYYTRLLKAVTASEPAGDPYVPLSADTYFEVLGDNDENIDSYYLRYKDDSYYYNGYQTLFVLNEDGTAVAKDTAIHPTFLLHDAAIYMSKPEDGETASAGRIENLNSYAVTLTGTVTQEHYSANSESNEYLKNYWVSYVTQHTGGPELFVNGVSNAAASHRTEDGGYERVVVLDDAHGEYHDFFIANIGDEPLTNLKVTLSADATGVALDEYWNGGDGTIGAFTSISASEYQNFITKVRLVPTYDENGNQEPIRGTLTISGAGATYKIKLVGYAKFAIETTTLKDAVKYVVYDQLIQTNSMGDSGAVKFETNYTDGTGSLPNALSLSSTGVLYGVPKVEGDYDIKVKATQDLSGKLGGLATGSGALQDYKYLVRGTQTAEAEFTLTVRHNEDYYVWGWGETGLVHGTPDYDPEYTIIQAIPNQDGSTTNITEGNEESDFSAITEGNEGNEGNEESDFSAPTNGEAGVNDWNNSELYLVTLGEYARFRELYLDGEKLAANVDYKYDPGSTILTIYTQSLANTSVGTGTHTLSAAFYDTSMDDQTLKHASQNYTVTTTISSSAGGSAGDDGSTGGGSSTTSPSGSTPSQSTPAQEPDNSGWPFIDVPLTSKEWYLDDVRWVYENGYMTGTSATLFSPVMSITQPIIVTTLARLAAVDLDSIAYVAYEGIPEGVWYSAAAIWAKEAGLLPESVFSDSASTSREDMAIMLVKYLNRMGIDCTAPDNVAVFSDADQMSEAGMAAFQVLYKYGIFKGVGDGYMNPTGETSRTQYAALLHRIVALLSA